MTQIEKEMIKCAKCGEESEQFIVYSVNYLLGLKEENDKLMHHKQKCPKCGYEAFDISKKENTNKTLD